MAYRNIKKLMQDCASPSTYNFELECDYEDYKALPLFERYLVYKSTALGDHILKEAEKSGLDERWAEGCYHEAANFCVDSYRKYDLPDCDGWGGRCKLAIDLYQQLWGWKEGDSSLYRAVEPIVLGGDTFNSVQTTLNRYIHNIVENDSEYKQHIMPGGNASIRFCIQLYCMEKDLSNSL